MASQRWLVMPRTLCMVSRRGEGSSAMAMDHKHKNVAGDREVVGFGPNGQTIYYDNIMFPFPAVRFKKMTPALMALKEKEKGDWKKLSIAEKKELYRASFCQTFEEMQAPTGEYKSVIGFGLIFVCVAILSHMALTYFNMWSSIGLVKPMAGSLCRRALSTTVILRDLQIIGSREVVGYGPNGQPQYEDNITFPYPSIRFREITPALKAIKEKERGDWKSLTGSEKKCLYRISFCQTLSEADAPTGEYKSIIGLSLVFVNIAVLFHLFIKILTWEDLPNSFDEKSQEAQLRRILDLRMNPIDGISSKWDYETDDWIQ